MKVYIGPYVPWHSGRRLEEWYIKKRHNKPYWDYNTAEGDRLDRFVYWCMTKVVFPILRNTINRFYDWKGRKVNIRIDKYDTWSMDHTLALIIHPMLLQLKETKNGGPHVDDEDVPEELRSTSARELTQEEKDNGHTDDNYFKRWDYVLDEMIFAFESSLDDKWEDKYFTGTSDTVWEEVEIADGVKGYQMKEGPNHTRHFDKEGYDKELARIQNGHRLFGKYYMNLWD